MNKAFPSLWVKGFMMGPNKWMFLFELIASSTTTTTTTSTTTTTTTVVLLLYLCARNVYEWKHYIDVYSSCIIYGTNYFYAPLEKRGILFCNCRSVCRPIFVRSISFDPFTRSILNLVQELPSMSRWSLLIFRSHVQRSRSNHSSQTTVLSAQYLLSPSLDQYQTWCRGCAQ